MNRDKIDGGLWEGPARLQRQPPVSCRQPGVQRPPAELSYRENLAARALAVLARCALQPISDVCKRGGGASALPILDVNSPGTRQWPAGVLCTQRRWITRWTALNPDTFSRGHPEARAVFTGKDRAPAVAMPAEYVCRRGLNARIYAQRHARATENASALQDPGSRTAGSSSLTSDDGLA